MHRLAEVVLPAVGLPCASSSDGTIDSVRLFAASAHAHGRRAEQAEQAEQARSAGTYWARAAVDALGYRGLPHRQLCKCQPQVAILSRRQPS